MPDKTDLCRRQLLSVDWKTFLVQYLMVPRTLRVSMQHLFRFDNAYPGFLFVRDLTCTEQWKQFKPLKKNDLLFLVMEATFKFSWHTHSAKPLINVPFSHQDNHQAYLESNICHRYHPNDAELKARYFGNGFDKYYSAWPNYSNRNPSIQNF